MCVDNPGHIPTVDLDRETVSRVAAWAADFVFEVFYPIPSFRYLEPQAFAAAPVQIAGACSTAVAVKRIAAANSSVRLSISGS
jgi:hypothetical protein